MKVSIFSPPPKRPESPLPYHFCHLLLSFLALVFIPAATAQTPPPRFEVASVRPSSPDADPKTGNWTIPGKGQITASHVSLALLIKLAFDLDDSQITNKPGWLDSKLYDIIAKAEDGIQLTREELRPRLQDLLQQRFHLVVHTETHNVRGYVLVVAKDGPHLISTSGDRFPGFRINVSPGQMRGLNWSMAQLAKYLTPAAHFPVTDETGIAGSYDISFSYDPDPQAESTLPSLNEALRQATGLVLQARKVPVEFLVIDSADSVPAEN
jgi:uncharacterized protein (TIGR03435 family)